jgi:hypothetical protein
MLCGQNTEFLYSEAGGTSSKSQGLKGEFLLACILKLHPQSHLVYLREVFNPNTTVIYKFGFFVFVVGGNDVTA